MKMEEDCIVPQILDIAPPYVANVIFPTKAIVNMGNLLTPIQTRFFPLVRWKADPNDYYTLCFIDLDVPSCEDPVFRSWQHWLVVNIQGNCAEEGETITEYIGPCPARGTGYHRFLFVIYKQPKKLEFNEQISSRHKAARRDFFSLRKFSKKYKMGDPIASNFFFAKWDEYVQVIYEQLRS